MKRCHPAEEAGGDRSQQKVVTECDRLYHSFTPPNSLVLMSSIRAVAWFSAFSNPKPNRALARAQPLQVFA
ncbi:MAG: hypothetical protein EAZ60_05535 [Oscillatoriales cyanobacterium]|nr:MAG: hypothetical protein EAZ60_05535 [Oscillatoriales cyanobacterium]